MNIDQYEQFLLENKLAEEIRRSDADQRKVAYRRLYSEFFSKFPKVSYDSESDIDAKIEWQMRLLKPLLSRNLVFVEVGAGNCLLSLVVAKEVGDVIAYEVADSAYQIPQKPENLVVKVFDGVDFFEKENSVDLIYSNDVFEHLHTDDALHHLKQYHRMLKNGGKLMIVTPHSLTGPHDVSRYYSKKPSGLHIKEYLYGELRELFMTAGFKKIKIYMGGGKFGYFSVNIKSLMIMEKVYSKVPISLRYRLKNNIVLKKLFAIKILGEK